MPVNHQKSDSWDMDSDWSSSCGLSDLSSGSSWDSRSSSSRSRSFTSDDESLKYLTREEKDVILFFEETLDSLEDNFEQVPCDSAGCCHFPQSQEGSTSSSSEPDVIDLVQPVPVAGEPEGLPGVTDTAGAGAGGKEDILALECGIKDVETSSPPESTVSEAPAQLSLQPAAAAPALPRKELLSPPPAEHPKLPRSVPTPLVIAKKISEKLVEKEALSPISPSKEARSAEWNTLIFIPPRTGDRSVWHRHSIQPPPKIHRFPSNISVTNSAGKEFNKTISKAAVNVQERKAQVLANINGVSFLSMGETEDQAQKVELPEQRKSILLEQGTCDQSKPGPVQKGVSRRAEGQASSQQSRGVQTEQTLASDFLSIHDVLKSEPGALFSAGKTVTIRPSLVPTSKPAHQQASKSLYKHQQPDCGQAARKQSGSLPRAVGFRPQGITVQFAGRGSTEEARREALRKLGLLKENL
ncbi:proline and serine-rich protein 2 [Saccopteryx leptura]|uniref:proline and serine-rich protein 2 n=1 Tax=Saccopteryx leptura TaxID=249018 RepID=UPI00339C581C